MQKRVHIPIHFTPTFTSRWYIFKNDIRTQGEKLDDVSAIKYKSHSTLTESKQGTSVNTYTTNNNGIAWFAGSYTKGTK